MKIKDFHVNTFLSISILSLLIKSLLLATFPTSQCINNISYETWERSNSILILKLTDHFPDSKPHHRLIKWALLFIYICIYVIVNYLGIQYFSDYFIPFIM